MLVNMYCVDDVCLSKLYTCVHIYMFIYTHTYCWRLPARLKAFHKEHMASHAGQGSSWRFCKVHTCVCIIICICIYITCTYTDSASIWKTYPLGYAAPKELWAKQITLWLLQCKVPLPLIKQHHMARHMCFIFFMRLEEIHWRQQGRMAVQQRKGTELLVYWLFCMRITPLRSVALCCKFQN